MQMNIKKNLILIWMLILHQKSDKKIQMFCVNAIFYIFTSQMKEKLHTSLHIFRAVLIAPLY